MKNYFPNVTLTQHLRVSFIHSCVPETFIGQMGRFQPKWVTDTPENVANVIFFMGALNCMDLHMIDSYDAQLRPFIPRLGL